MLRLRCTIPAPETRAFSVRRSRTRISTQTASSSTSTSTSFSGSSYFSSHNSSNPTSYPSPSTSSPAISKDMLLRPRGFAGGNRQQQQQQLQHYQRQNSESLSQATHSSSSSSSSSFASGTATTSFPSSFFFNFGGVDFLLAYVLLLAVIFFYDAWTVWVCCIALALFRWVQVSSEVAEESITIVRDIGVQLRTVRASGATRDTFIEMAHVRSLLITEVVRSYTVHYALALRVRRSSSVSGAGSSPSLSSSRRSRDSIHGNQDTEDASETDDEDLILVFTHLIPRLPELLTVYRGAHEVLPPHLWAPSRSGDGGTGGDGRQVSNAAGVNVSAGGSPLVRPQQPERSGSVNAPHPRERFVLEKNDSTMPEATSSAVAEATVKPLKKVISEQTLSEVHIDGQDAMEIKVDANTSLMRDVDNSLVGSAPVLCDDGSAEL